MKALVAGLAAPVALVLAVAVIVPPPVAAAAGGPPSAVALAEIPPNLLPVYQAAAATCPGLPWQVLAAIGALESGHAQGRADPATGDVSPPIMGPAIDGRPGFAAIRDPSSSDGWAHALGPMQFLSTTWARWARLAPGRPPGAVPSAHNAWDAIHAAAAKLCADADGSSDLSTAIYAYNRSDAYVDAVLAKAVAYGMGQAGGPVAGLFTGSGTMVAGSGDAVVVAAMRALGTPYVWGGESPGGFDCSGLVQWAYAQTGVRVPRTTREQINIGIPVGVNDLRPGDLVFTRGGRVPTDLGHVAIYAGNGMVIVAPRTGQTVQFRVLVPGSVQAVRRVLSA